MTAPLSGILAEKTVVAVVCNQWGDTGKGKLVDYSCSPGSDSNFIGAGFGNYINCSNGCSDGACINKNITNDRALNK